MMDQFVANLLNKYLGKYIQNLESENLNVGIFNGEVELTDLQLRPEALFELQLPVEVKAGYVGKISLSIPWISLYSSPVTAILEDVYILVGPIADRKYDAAKEEALQNAVKRQMLDILEYPQNQSKGGSTDGDQGFMEKMMATVVNNIQISVHRIHIRYEDNVTNRQHPFACGLMLKKLTAETTNIEWKPTQIDGSTTRMHKLVQLDGLSLYWNPYLQEQSMVRTQLHTTVWRSLLKNSIDTLTIKAQELDFIVRPVSATCKLVLNKASASVMPKLMVDFTLDDIEVLISRLQFLNMLSLVDSMRMMTVNQRYRKYSTGQPVSGHASTWWKYAYKAVVEETIRPFSWERISRVRQRYRTYKDMYKQHLGQPDTESIMNQLYHMEDDLDITNILVAREHAKLEFAQEAPDRAHKEKIKKGWWDRMWTSDDEDDDDEIVIDSTAAKNRLSWIDQLTTEEREKLYNAVGYDENENVEHIPQYVAHKLNLCLKSCSVSLVNYGKEVLKVSVTNMITSFENRPDSDGFGASAKTESFVLEGVSIERELIPLVTSDIGVYELRYIPCCLPSSIVAPSKVTDVFSFEFEKRPLQLEADFAVRMNVQPVEMVYDEHAVTEVIAFFQVPHISVTDVKKMAQAGLERFTSISRAGLQYAIEQHKTVHVSVNMRSPYIVIPEYGTLHRGGNLIVVDFGKLKVESELQPKNISLEECTLSEIESRLYDKFNITITEVKALLADSAEDWHTAQTKPDSEYHVLPSVGMQLAFFNTVKHDYTRLPQQKVEAKLPTLKLNLSDEKIHMFASFFKHIPMPHSNSMMGLDDSLDGGIHMEPLTSIMEQKDAQREPTLQELIYMRRSVLKNSVVRRGSKVLRKKKARSSVRSSDSEYYSASDHSDEELEDWSRNISATTVDDQTSASNVIRLLARFTLGEVLVQVSKSADRIDTPYLMFRINRLCADAALTSYGVALQASLGGIELVDKIHLGSSGEYLEVLSSKSETDLISVSYRKVEPACPDFESVYRRVEQTMLLRMSSLHMMFDRAAVLYLITFTQGLLLSIRGGMDRGMQKSTSTVLSGHAEQSQPDAPSLLQRLTSQVEEGVTAGTTQLHLVAKLDDLEMKLCDHENDFAEIKARGLEGIIIKKPSKVTFHVKMSDFSVDDLTENTLYPRLLVIEDDEVFDLKFVSYTRPAIKMDATSKKRSAVDMSLRLRIGRLQGTLLYKFVAEIKNFMDPFMNPELRKAYGAAAKKAINSKIQDVQEQGTRIRLAVDIKAPSVHVPQNSESTSVIVLKLGDLHVTNEFEESDVGGVVQNWDHMYLLLDAVKVIRGKLNMNGFIEHVHTIVDPTNLRLDLKRALPPIQTDCTHDLSGHLHMIKIQVTQLDLKVVMAILQENFSETGNKPESVDEADLSPQLADVHVLVTQDSTDTQLACLESTEPLLATPDASETVKQVRFMFMMDGTQLRLLQEDEDPLVSPGQEEMEGLSQFEAGKLDISGLSNNDGSLEVDLCLKSVSLDDVREHSNLAVKRLIQSSNHGRSKYDTAPPPMFHIQYKQDAESNRYIDVNLEMVRVNLCVAYLVTVARFLTDALQLPEDVNGSKVKAKVARPSPRSLPGGSAQQNAARPALTVSGRFKKPEIVLFAEPDSAHSRVLVLKASGVFDYSSHLGRTQIEAKVKQLQMFSGYYGLSQQTASMVLHPCDLEFTQSQEASDAELKMNVTMSDVSLHVSATMLHIFFNVMDIINEDRKMELSASNAVMSMNADYFDLWTTNNISSREWLNLQDESDNTPKYPVWPVAAPVESLTVTVKQVRVLFEVENQDYQVPRLSVRTGLDATVHDWTRQIHGEVSLSVDVSCYNDQLSVWEPLLEPVMKQEDVYTPWKLVVKFVQAESLPISCEFDSVEAGKPDDIDGDIHYLLCRARNHSDSSEMETDSDNEMTVIQSKRIRQASDRSHDSASRCSIQGDSDSETEVISTISTNLDSMLSSDSSDIEFSDDDAFEEAEKPVFLTARGPIRVDSEMQEEDVMDGSGEKKVDEMCTYILIDSRDELSVSLTPHAIDVIMTISKTLLKSDDTLLQSIHDLPGFEVYNQLGINAKISLSPDLKDVVVNTTRVQERPNMVRLSSQLSMASAHNVEVTSGGQDVQHNSKEDETDLDLDDVDGLSIISRALAQTANTAFGASAFVFDPNHDPDSDHHRNIEIQKGKMNLKVDGFDELFNLSHRKAAATLVQLTPNKDDTVYCVVFDVAVTHGRKVVTIRSPLQLHNHMDVSMVIYCDREQLQRHGAGNLAQSENGQLSRIHTLEPGQVYDVPLYIAYHCTLFAAPEGLGYEKTISPIWWQEVSTTRDKNRYFKCPSLNEEEKAFLFKVTCSEGSETPRPDTAPRVIPYYSLHCYAPVILHNLLPYDVEFSLQEVGVNTLSHGENTPLYMADLSKTPKLQLQLTDYLGLDWSGSLELSTELEPFKAVNMECDNSVKAERHQLSISVHVTCEPTMHLYLYSPYWLINDTGLPIQIRGSRSDAIYENDTSQDPLLFRFKAHRRKKAKLKVYNSKWTHSFPLDTVGTSGVIICHDKERNRKYQFLLHIQLSTLRLTKIVTIMPYFVIVNNTMHDLRYMEENEQADLWLDIAPQQCMPSWPVTDSYRMSVKYRESNVCSAHFDISKTHRTVLRMDKGTALCVEVSGGTDSSVTITLLPYDHGDAPVRVENLCEDVFIKLHQKNQSQVSLLSPNQSVLYTWDSPSTERTLMWNVYNRKRPSYPAFIAKDGFGEVALSILMVKNKLKVTDSGTEVDDSTDDEDSDVESLRVHLVKNMRTDKVTVHWVSYVDRLQRVLLFTQDERVAKRVRKVNEAELATTALFLSLGGIGVSLINGRSEEVAYVTLSSSTALWEVEMRSKWKTLNVELASWLEEQWSKDVSNVTLEDVMQADLQNMEMKKPFIGALRRVYNPSLWIQYRQSLHHKYFHARVHRLQIDNQLTDAYFPTVLFPTPLPSYAAKDSGPRPFIEMIVARYTVPEQNIDTFKYVKVLIQELSLQLDKGFILSLLDIFSGQQPAQKESAQLMADLAVAHRSLRDVAAVQAAARPQRIMFEYLHLSPIKLMLSFSLDGRVHTASRPDSITADIIDFFLTSVGATITEMKDVELKMAFFDRQGALLTFDQLVSQVKGHYLLQVMQQAYVFVLGLDVLGNPYGLVKDFTKGLGDFFYEPMMGTIQGPDKVAENLVRGVQSLMGHTIGSMAGSVSLITGSLGKTLAILSFDSDYRKRRRQYMQQHPAHLPESLYLAGRGFVMGVALGLSGVVVHPFRGAQEEGVEGFFKGIGKGLLGLITKPPGGTVDMVSMAFDGIRRAAEMGEDVIVRMRLPRYINPYTGLKPYSPYQAIGMRMLNGVAKGQFAKTDIYWAHAALTSDDRADVALVSDKRVLVLGRCRCWGDWDVDMDVLLEDIMTPPAIVDNMLVFRVREGTGFNLVTSGERVIKSDDPSVLLWLQQKIEKVMKVDDL